MNTRDLIIDQWRTAYLHAVRGYTHHGVLDGTNGICQAAEMIADNAVRDLRHFLAREAKREI